MFLDIPVPDDISVGCKELQFEKGRNIKDVVFLGLEF